MTILTVRKIGDPYCRETQLNIALGQTVIGGIIPDDIYDSPFGDPIRPDIVIEEKPYPYIRFDDPRIVNTCGILNCDDYSLRYTDVGGGTGYQKRGNNRLIIISRKTIALNEGDKLFFGDPYGSEIPSRPRLPPYSFEIAVQ